VFGLDSPLFAKGKRAGHYDTHTPRVTILPNAFFLSSSSAPGSPIFFFFLGKNVSTTRVKIKEGEEEELFKNMGNFLFLFSRVL
jgi:hypothetical protein